jgi:iron complex outermembrane receptor protein
MKRLALWLLFYISIAPAQTHLSVKGTVTDPDGAAVTDARVYLYRVDTNSRSSTATGPQGNYSFDSLLPGRFVVEVEKEGFQKVTRAVDLSSQPETVNIQLGLAGVSQSVVVTANDTTQTIDEIAKALTVMTGTEIQNRNEFALSEALRTVPGVQIQNLGGPGQFTTMRIRGLRADAAAVLVDGLRFRDASTTQGDASSFLSTLNFVATDRVEVLRGSGSSLYGTNAVGGVVNVITDDGGSPTRGSLLLEGGSLGMFRGRAGVGGGAWNDRLRYSGRLLHLNVVNGVDGNDANRSTGGQGSTRFDLTPTMNLTGRLWASDDFVQLNSGPTTAGIPAANFAGFTVVPVRIMSPANVAILLNRGTPDYTGVTLIPSRDDPDNRRSSRFYTAAAVFRHIPTARFNWQTSYQRVHTSRVFENGPLGDGFQPSALNFGNYVGDIDTVNIRGNAILASWLTLSVGYEFEREAYFDRQDNNLPGTRRVATRTNIQQNSNAAHFASQLSLLGRRLQISASGRAQTFNLSRPRFDFTGTANNYEQFGNLAPPRALTGDLAISYMLFGSNTKLRAHAGNAYRAPSLYERFGGGFASNPVTGVISFTPYGDPRLFPDRYNNVDCGIDQYLFNNKVRASATYFYTRVVSITAFNSSGAINPATDPFGRFSGYINGSGGISRGVELSIEARPTRSTLINVSYTNLNVDQDRDLQVRGFFKVTRVQENLLTFVVSQDWTRRFNTTVDFFFGSDYYDAYFAAGASRAFLNPGYSKTDLVASYRIWEGERASVRLYGKGENVFDRTIYQSGYRLPGATALVGVDFRF